MIQQFTADMSQLRIYAHGDELSSILWRDRTSDGRRIRWFPDTERELVYVLEHPVLVTDKMQHAKILEPITRYTVEKLYEAKTKVTEYLSRHGTTTSLSFTQSEYPQLWWPSYDTIALCQAADMLDLSQVRYAIEPGGGSGFPSQHLLTTLPWLERMDIVDINPDALLSWEKNIQDERANFVIGDVHEILGEADQVYDLVISNPPYVPRPQSIDDNPYEWVSLLVDMIESADRYLRPDGVLLLNYSHLCQKYVDATIARTGMQMETLLRRQVPFKVTPIMNNTEWFEFLLKEKDLQILPEHPDHMYRHTIIVAKIHR